MKALHCAAAALGLALAAAPAGAADPHGLLETIKRHSVLTPTVPDNGDQNPYAIVVAPVSAGPIQKDDVLVDNFNDANNLQGLGTTIVGWRPSTRQLSLVAQVPRQLAGCPGGVGLTTAMAMLRTGWIIVGSAPSTDGTTATKGPGCLIVLDPTGNVADVWSGPDINDPWGNVAVVDRGDTATLFVSNAGFDVGPPDDDAPVVAKATVLRLDLAIAAGKPPAVTRRTVVGSGFGEQADKSVFLIGPTGLALAADDTLYVSDALGTRIAAIDHASTRGDSAGTGREVTRDGLLKRPLALVVTASGNLLTTNGLNGQVVEIEPRTGKQLYARWIDPNKAQTPPGSGDLFGLALTPAGDGFYYVEDEVNMLVLAR